MLESDPIVANCCVPEGIQVDGRGMWKILDPPRCSLKSASYRIFHYIVTDFSHICVLKTNCRSLGIDNLVSDNLDIEDGRPSSFLY